MEILILNGPNLNLIGIRQPEVYGDLTMDEVIGDLRSSFPEVSIHHYHSNHEGGIIDKLQEVGYTYDGIILNAGGYTHTSIAIADCIAAITTPVLEVHISDIHNREEFRKQSYMEPHVIHRIIGKGTQGYHLAVRYFIENVTPRS